MQSLSLFSGIGGVEVALSQLGVESVAFCDVNKYCQQVLKSRWPGVPIFGDIKELDKDALSASGVPFEGIKMITGGYPCQNHSVIGKRLGKEDERHLWPEMFRLIKSIQPDYFIGENVEGLLSSSKGEVFGDILTDVTGINYKVGWCCYPASDVGCSHIRSRVFSFGLNSNHSGWMPDKQIVQNAIISWLSFFKWPALPGYIQFAFEPPRVVFSDPDKDRAKRVKTLGNAVSPMQIFPMALALICRGDLKYLDFSEVDKSLLDFCASVKFLEKKISMLEECFDLIQNVLNQKQNKIFAHLNNETWYAGDKPFVGNSKSNVTKWCKWGYALNNGLCVEYKRNSRRSEIINQFPVQKKVQCTTQWHDMNGAFWRTPTSECGVNINSLIDHEGNPPSKFGVRIFRRNKDGTITLQSVTLNQQVAMCHKWESELGLNCESIEPEEFVYQEPINIMWSLPCKSTHDNVSMTIDKRITKPHQDGRVMLNPDWEELLMGFPVGWTKLTSTEAKNGQ